MYNPTSTGPSRTNAKKLAAQIEEKTTNSVVKLTPTKFPGHAEKLAAETIRKYPSALLVSSSGDGTYHEMINGVMKTKKNNAKIVTAVLPSGNANDHYRAVHESTVIESILKDKTKRIGLLQLTATQGPKVILDRYAHSYVGFGVSSTVARSLNKGNKSPISEKWASLKIFFTFRPFKIKSEGKVLKLDSLLIGNIAEMAKVLEVAKNVEPEHKTFGLTLHSHHPRFHLISYFTGSVLYGQEPQKRLKKFEFQLLKKTSLQMDGETYSLNAGAVVTVRKKPDALKVLG